MPELLSINEDEPKAGGMVTTRTVSATTAIEAERLLPRKNAEYLNIDEFIVDENIYQKRRPSVEKDHDRKQQLKLSHDLISAITQYLKEHEDNHATTPVVVAQFYNEEYAINRVLVDGHHRHAAYKNAGRKLIPAKVIDVRKQEVAEDLAYTLNLGSETISVTKRQKMQQAWEMVLKNHQHDHEWLNGWSANKLGKHFGNITTTVKRMVERKNELGEDAHGMTWEQARNKREYKQLTEVEQARKLYKIAENMIQRVAHSEDIHVLANILYDIHNGRVPSDSEQYIEKLAEDMKKGRIVDLDSDDGTGF